MTRKLYLYRSNRAEQLTRGLAHVLRKPVADPMRAERVVVQGRGMATWLSQQLAEQLSVFTNAEFLYPRNFIQLAFDEVLSPSDEQQLHHSRDALFWGVFSALAQLPEAVRADPSNAELSQLKPVLDYYADDASGLRMQQLAARAARCFDQYLVYRPDLLRAWGQGQAVSLPPQLMSTARWQAALWRRLPEPVQHTHIANLEPAFQQRVDDLVARAPLDGPEQLGAHPGAPAPSLSHGLPERVCIFGLTSLPPLYLRTLTRLADLVEIHVFSLAPSRAWFADQLAPRQQARTLSQGTIPEAQPHALLASWGQIGADFQQLLEDHAPGYQEPAELFVDPHGDSHGPAVASEQPLLSALQRGILDLDESQVDAPIAALLAGAQDRSISLHSCHGPMREVEVLHDVLLDLLERQPDLAPQDIAVMAPDIERYAPLIEAVFERPRRLDMDNAEPAESYVPYRIADRSVRHDAPVLEGVRRICALVGGRRTASQLLDLLNLTPIARRFEIDVAELDQIAEWMQESGIRWGIDAADRALHGQPASAQNTWRFGLDRLLLGYGLPGAGRQLFAGCLPFDELEGQQAELAGKLAAFAESLFLTLQQLEAPRSISAWQQVLTLTLSQLFDASGDYAWQHQRVLAALEDIQSGAESALFSHDISLSVLTPLLEERLDEAQPAKSFLTGGVTFCAMVPMRSIPFQVVCLLGMDEDAFPRRDASVGFDLMQADPRPGDRSRTLDDRYLFLEALLSARQRLVITYSGQSIRDNSQRPPSVVIDELLDHLESRLPSGFRAASAERQPGTAAPQPQDTARLLRSKLVTSHPLQAFSRRYFDGSSPELFSFRRDLCRGAASALGARGQPAALFERRLSPPDITTTPGATQRVRVSDLARFIARPIEYLLERRLGVYLRGSSAEILDREPLELGPLEQHTVGDQLLQLSLAAVPEDQALLILRAAGKLPLGTSGAVAHHSLVAETRALRRAFTRATGQTHPTTHLAAVTLPCGVLLEGAVERVYGERLVRARFVRPSAQRLLPLWVEHLVWCAIHAGGGGSVTPSRAAQSLLLLRPTKGKSDITRYTLSVVKDPVAALDTLCQLMLIGQTEPLHFFPEAALAFVSAPADKDPMRSASSRYREALSRDPYLSRVFGADRELETLPRLADAQGPAFAELARTIFEPLLAHLEPN